MEKNVQKDIKILEEFNTFMTVVFYFKKKDD